MITFDTCAWIEYLNGTEKGATVRYYIDGGDIIFTPSICLAELKAKMLFEKRSDAYIKRIVESILKRSLLMQLDGDIALKAAELKNGGLPLVDSVIYATALRNSTNLLTCDKHFREYEKAEFLD